MHMNHEPAPLPRSSSFTDAYSFEGAHWKTEPSEIYLMLLNLPSGIQMLLKAIKKIYTIVSSSACLAL